MPVASDVASALAQLGRRQDWTGDDDLVFPGLTGGYLDGSGLRKRYKAALTAAGLRQLRFHDLRHTFGTRMIAKADIRRVQEWMGHADVQTTMRYLRYAPRAEDARLVAEVFQIAPPPPDAGVEAAVPDAMRRVVNCITSVWLAEGRGDERCVQGDDESSARAARASSRRE